MPRVLTTNAQILCAHGTPAVKKLPIAPLWTINGGTVLVEDDSGTFPSCPSLIKCGEYVLRSMGFNATFVSGRKVILDTDFNLSATGLPLTMIEIHPVFDETTPAAIPDGEPAPPLPPEMTDLVKPEVSASLTEATYILATQLPSPIVVTFTLKSAHPMLWILTQIDESGPPPGFTNRTNTQPAGMAIDTTSRGVWNVSPFNIKLTLTSAFMNFLLPGDHRFFLTGVSQRGLSSFAQLKLIVKQN